MASERASWEIPFGDGRARPIEVALHRADVGRIAVMMPGWDGDIDGWEQKYAKMADLLAGRGIAAVVRMGNHPVAGLPFETSSPDQLRGVARRAVAEATALCGSATPELLGLGMSAGASAMAACAGDLPGLTRLLLLAPSADCELQDMRSGLAAYRGALFVVVGADDEVVGRRLPEDVFRMAPDAARAEMVVVPACDHQFRGPTNGRILSQAPLWAFADDAPFPDPGRGIHLYD